MMASTTPTLTAVSVQYANSTATTAGRPSPVDVPEDEVQRGEDRDDVGDVRAAQHPRQDRDVVEAGRADLAAERPEATLRDHVVAHLAERVLGVHPRLARGHLDDAGHLGLDGSRGQPVEQLLDDH